MATAYRHPTTTPTPAHDPGPPVGVYALCTVRQAFDDLADGTIQEVITFVYNEASELARTDWDYDADGTVDAITHYEYDADWRPLRVEGDRGADGSIDSRRTYSYDDAGRLVRREGDENADGRPEWWYTFAYDDAGNVILQRQGSWRRHPVGALLLRWCGESNPHRDGLQQ
jgi:YD repeat-containing protein